MKVNWLLSQEVFQGRPGDGLELTCASYPNINVVTYSYDRDLREYVTEDELICGPVVCHGPIKFCNQIYRKLDRHIFTSFKADLHTHRYMSHYPLEWFLNSDVEYMTYAMLKSRGIDRETFIRPDSPFKTFTGFSINPDNIDFELSSLKQIQKISDDELLLVSKAKDIDYEFRVIIIDSKVVTYSSYRWDDFHYCTNDILPECLELAERVAGYPYQIDNAYVLDVCMSEGVAKIVEINSICSSGLYRCDQNLFVSAMNDAAIKDYDEVNSI